MVIHNHTIVWLEPAFQVDIIKLSTKPHRQNTSLWKRLFKYTENFTIKKKKKKKKNNFQMKNSGRSDCAPRSDQNFRCPHEHTLHYYWYWLTVGQGLLSLKQESVEGECFYFFCFFTFTPVPLSSLSLSFISSTISSISFLPFSGRRHKMIHKGWRVNIPQRSQLHYWLSKMGTVQIQSRIRKCAVWIEFSLGEQSPKVCFLTLRLHCRANVCNFQ